YRHIEYIVIDGGSRDESVDILRSYGNRLTWVYEPDRGQTDAINKGFTRSHGSIRAYLNSDDVLLPGAVSRVVGHFQRHPEWDLVYGKAHIIDEHDRVTGVYPTAEYDFSRLMENCCICQPGAFWRTDIARRLGPFNDRLHYVMDYDWWIRMDRAGGRLLPVPELHGSSRRYPEPKTISARPAVSHELFATCLREAGFVSYSHFHAYWHHLCHERADGWPRRLRRLPRFAEVMAKLHHRWYH